VKIPRDLTGSDLAKVLCRDWRYRVIHQEGSHIILETENLGTNASQCRRTPASVLEPSVRFCGPSRNTKE